MAKIFYEDAYCLGLLYSYIYAGKKMVIKEDLDSFYTTIENNLKDTDAKNIDSRFCSESNNRIYYLAEGKNREIYYVLYPDFDLERAKSLYMGCLSAQEIQASLEDNSLECLGLHVKDGKIQRKENHHIGMISPSSFMSQFIEKLKNGELKIDKCPQVEVEDEINEEFIIQQLESYQKLLNSKFFGDITKEEPEPVKKISFKNIYK